MNRYKNIREAYPICDAIGSPVRLEILEQILEHRSINLDTIAKNLHLTNGALTKHIKKLENAGLVKVRQIAGRRGNQKVCSLRVEKILIEVAAGIHEEEQSHEIPLGLYADYAASGLCGIVSEAGFIGSRDSAAAFLDAGRAQAAALWLQKGFVSYLLPYPRDTAEHPVREIRVSFEISPDIIGGGRAFGFVQLAIDDESIGNIKIYPPTVERRGYGTPHWFDAAWPQYGTLKLLRITHKGTFMDGEKISALQTQDAIMAKKITLSTDTGFMLFGKGFGDYNQAIRCVIQSE